MTHKKVIIAKFLRVSRHRISLERHSIQRKLAIDIKAFKKVRMLYGKMKSMEIGVNPSE